MIVERLFRSFVDYLRSPIEGEELPLPQKEARSIQTHFLIMVATGGLMWGYAILAYYTIGNPWPGIVGFIASGIHLLSPLLYRMSRNILLISGVMVFSGLAHQSTFAYFTGGFESNIIIWFGVLPFVAALIAGRRAAIIWCLITFCVAGIFLALHLQGHVFPTQISSEGQLIAQMLIVFGWIFLSAFLCFFYFYEEEQLHRIQLEQKSRIENLFRILCHDLGNPLSLLQMAIERGLQSKDVEQKNQSLLMGQKAVSTISEITQNVRRMYTVQEGQAEIQSVPISLNSAIEQLQFLFQNPLMQKDLRLVYDFDQYSTAVVLVDPVSFVHQVLGNILSNAVKFSEPQGCITIKVMPAEKGQIKLSIEDCGIGMPEKIRQNLFDVKVKTTRPGTSGERGTGFGMHLMKLFVEKYGGQVEVHSREKTTDPRHGTTFTLTLKGSM